jgi:hypothetical protein
MGAVAPKGVGGGGVYEANLPPMPITVASRSKAWTVFSRSNTGIVGSNPIQCTDVCVCVYSVFVLSCVYVAALWRADHSSKESYRLCKEDYETEEEARAQQRAVSHWWMNEWTMRPVYKGNVENNKTCKIERTKFVFQQHNNA